MLQFLRRVMELNILCKWLKQLHLCGLEAQGLMNISQYSLIASALLCQQ